MRVFRSSLAPVLAAACLVVTLSAGCSTNSGGGANTSAGQPTATGAGAVAGAGPAFNACRSLTVAEVGAILGGTVTARDALGNTCWFQQADAKAPYISVAGGIPASGTSAIAAAKTSAEEQIDAKAVDLTGVGDAAYIIVGKAKATPADPAIQAAGGVVVKGQLIAISLVQGKNMTVDQVTKLITDVVKLVAVKA